MQCKTQEKESFLKFLRGGEAALIQMGLCTALPPLALPMPPRGLCSCELLWEASTLSVQQADPQAVSAFCCLTCLTLHKRTSWLQLLKPSIFNVVIPIATEEIWHHGEGRMTTHATTSPKPLTPRYWYFVEQFTKKTWSNINNAM